MTSAVVESIESWQGMIATRRPSTAYGQDATLTLRHQIGHFLPGGRALPSSRELTGAKNRHRATVRRATDYKAARAVICA